MMSKSAWQDFLDSCPPIEVGYCPECDEEDTWLIQHQDGSVECYFAGCTIEEADA